MHVKKVPVHVSGQATGPSSMRLTYSGHELVTDEPLARGGTDTGPAPFDTMIASLAGCTHATLRLLADAVGVQVADVRVDVATEIDPSAPFGLGDVDPLIDIRLDIAVRTDATADQAERLRHELPVRCMANRVFTAAGIDVHQTWRIQPLLPPAAVL